MSNPKVFEFAKEIGMSPLVLMDKIREWQLPIKSHMAELDPGTLEIIRVKLKGPSEPEKAATEKKAPAKKRAPAAKASEKTGTAIAKPVTAVKKTVVKKATDAVTATPEPAVANSSVTSKSTVVRRKKVDPSLEAKHEGEEQETESHYEEETAQEETSPTSVVVKSSPAPESSKAATTETAAATEKAEVAVEKPKAQAVDQAAPAAAASTQSKAAVAPAPTGTGAAGVTAATSAEEGSEKKVVARKKEVSIGNSGVSSDAAGNSARRNIIGRMDLSRVQAPQGSYGGGGRPQGGGAPRPGGGYQRSGGPGGHGPGAAGGAGGATGGFAPRPKGNLRAGFVAAAPVPELSTERDLEEARKRDERRRLKGGAADPAGANFREEEEAPAFDAAEFRKREMVFQPKKKKGMLSRPSMQTQKTVAAAHKRVVKVNGVMKLSDLAMEMGLKVAELTKILMKNGVMATPNTDLDFDTIALIVPEFGWEAQNVLKTAEEILTDDAFGELDADPVIRHPVVTIMGHVDHGKTSLLDYIRKAKVAAGEAGGITQHIGAYQVGFDDGYKITFLDTPGHEAFTAMRARGANITDIAIIVVAADDGVMPQTAEAINHAKAAGVPIIVAVNKMDKPGANPDRVKQQLTEYEIVPEEWGGTAIFCPVSALKGTGIDELLQQIRLVAEVSELKANPKRSGRGAVVEARLDKGRGPVATILVRDGTMRVGQYIVAGTAMGRVRSMINDRGERVEEAGPAMPVEVLGLDSTPMAGDEFHIVKDERAAEEAVSVRKSNAEKAKSTGPKVSLEEIFAKVKAGDVKELAVVLKADVHGSLEAIQGMFSKLSTPEVKARIIHSAVGGITESDVLLASTAKGLIIGFNVRPDGGASAAAKRLGIEVRTYSIVYEMIDDMKKAMGGLLAPTIVEKVMGRAEVRNTFTVPKIGTIAGCFVSDGKIQRSNMARLIREGKIVYEGKIGSLKRFKDDAKEVATGFECGIGIENFNDLKVGDVIEAFYKEETARTLESSAEA